MIKVKVPELLKERGLNATALMRKANIAYATAYRLSKGQGTAISFDVLDRATPDAIPRKHGHDLGRPLLEAPTSCEQVVERRLLVT